MIRVLRRDEHGEIVGHRDYRTVRPDQVSVLLGMRFDRELVELAEAGYSLDVTRWAEAEWTVKGFSARSFYKLQELAGEMDPAVVDNDEILSAIANRPDFLQWIETQAEYRLTRTVTIWSAVNCGGGQMSLLEVLNLAPADVEDYEINDFLPEEEASGKD